MQTIQKYIVESKSVLFEGDGYSNNWEKEAEKRGLTNIKSTPEALDAYVSEKAKALFISNNVFSKSELDARHEIMLESYVKKIQIEARVLGDLVTTIIIPGTIKYQNILLQNINGLRDAGLDPDSWKAQKEIVEKISEHVNIISEKVTSMIEARKKANEIEDIRQTAIDYYEEVKEKHFRKIRYHVDKLELIVDDSHWALPKYRELLFMR